MGDEEIAVQAMKAGAFDYVSKDTQHYYLSKFPRIVENVLRRLRAEQRARELERERLRQDMLQVFISEASHDLRTSLATLNASLQIMDMHVAHLRELVGVDEPNLAALRKLTTALSERSQRAGEHQLQLQQNLLDMIEIVKVDNLQDIEMVEYDVRLLIEQILPSFMERTRQKSLGLRFESSCEPLRSRVNIEAFSAILRNLLRNALNFTPEGGTITVTTEGTASEAIFHVRDTGIGIPQDDLSNIFQRFYRVNRARTLDNSGSGLGLPIVKRLVELHGGRIEVESVVGQGSRFTVCLPRLVD
jgi:signal transduction histidine kinase